MWYSTPMDSTATGQSVSVCCDGVGCHVLCLRHVMSFLCVSTLVKVLLLQAAAVAIWPQMLNPKQTNKLANDNKYHYINVLRFALLRQIYSHATVSFHAHSCIVGITLSCVKQLPTGKSYNVYWKHKFSNFFCFIALFTKMYLFSNWLNI